MCVCVLLSHSVVSNSLQPYGLQPTRLHCPWDFPGKNTGVDCHFLLQGIFPTQESNPRLLCLLRWQPDSLPCGIKNCSKNNEFFFFRKNSIKKNNKNQLQSRDNSVYILSHLFSILKICICMYRIMLCIVYCICTCLCICVCVYVLHINGKRWVDFSIKYI